MNKRTFFSLAAVTGLVMIGGFSAYIAFASPRTAAYPLRIKQTALITTKTASAPALFPATSTSAVVDAANAFLATLPESKRTIVLTTMTPQNAARWSNFPAGVVQRNGVFFRDLTPEQVVAAMKVARLALSEEGFTRFQEVRAADDAFAKLDRGPGGGQGGRGRGGRGGFGGGPGGPGGAPPGSPGGFGGGQGGPPGGGFGGSGGRGPSGPGGGQNLFGAGNYTIAFLGQPSKTDPWLLQLGGHHLAFNLYYKGAAGTSTPYFVGAQPNTWKDADGKTHAPLAPMRDAMYSLVHSLSPDQQTRARLKGSFNDVLVGPGQDGHFPNLKEGVSASELSEASKTQLKKAIAAWTGDHVQSAAYRKRYDDELKQTKISYSGTTGVSASGDYVRIDGPHLWIEFVCQGNDHYHTIWRDRETDYGAEFSF